MTSADDMDAILRSWIGGDAAGSAPAHLFDAVVDTTRRRSQHRDWLARLTGGRHGVDKSHRRSGGLLLVVALVAGPLLAVVAGQILSVGGSPAPAPIVRIYTSSTPWSFDQPANVCQEGTAEALPPGPLPQVEPPAIAHRHNGMIAVDITTLIDPATGAVTTTHLPGMSSIYGNRWSPDGHWLATGWGGDPAGGAPPCGDINLLSSDGTRLVNVTGYPSDDQAIFVTWSADGEWLAIARLMVGPVQAQVGVAIDALRIAPDGSVVEGRRLWTSDATGVESLGWSSGGTLAWTYDPKDGSDLGLLVLRPGQVQPTSIDLGGIDLRNPRWSADGDELVAFGWDTSRAGGGIYIIKPSDGSVRSLDVAVPQLVRKYFGNADLFTSSDGRVFYPARTAATLNTDIYAARLDGTDYRNLTSFPFQGPDVEASDAVLSPDETQVAFRVDGTSQRETPGTWVVDVDGTKPAHLLHATDATNAYNGSISWQPVP